MLFFIFSLFFISLTTTTADQPIVIHPDDYNALISIYNSAGGDESWKWLIDDPCYRGDLYAGWPATFCGSCDKHPEFDCPKGVNAYWKEDPNERQNMNVTHRLLELDFLHTGDRPVLNGYLPEEIGAAINLREITVRNQPGLNGTIPSSLNQLVNLKTIRFESTSISGRVPSLSNLSKLESLILISNFISSFSNDTLLANEKPHFERLELNDNIGFEPTTLSSILGLDQEDEASTYPELVSLKLFNLGLISAHDSISDRDLGPKICTKFPSLRVLDLSNNRMQGIPNLGACSQLSDISISSNLLQGNLLNDPVYDWPNWTSKYLFTFSLQDNQLTGSLDWLHSSISLWRQGSVNLASNAFGPHFPDLCIADDDEKRSATVVINDNRFQTGLNNYLNCVRKDRNYDVSNNEFTGELPAKLSAWVYAEAFLFQNNRIEGSIPKWAYFHFENKVLDLSNNRLSGELDPYGWTTHDLRKIDLSGNEFTGTLVTQYPFALEYFDASDNQFTGPIPEQITEQRDLRTYLASNNQLSGPLPEKLGRLKDWGKFDFMGPLNHFPCPIAEDVQNNPAIEITCGCPAGYWSESISSPCSPCPANTYSNDWSTAKIQSCLPCADGQESSEGSIDCTTIPTPPLPNRVNLPPFFFALGIFGFCFTLVT